MVFSPECLFLKLKKNPTILKISNEFKVGVLAVIALVILFFGYNYIKGERLFAADNTFYAIFDNAAGLSKSDDVIYRGLSVGKIVSIHLKEDNPSLIVVTFSISTDILIPEDSEARITNSDLLGDKALEIILGKSTNMLAGGELKGTVEQSLSQQIEEELLPVKERIESLISSIDSVITRVNGIFDVNFQGKVDENLVSIEAAIVNIRSITENVDNLISMEVTRIDTILASVQTIATAISDNEQELRNTFSNLEMITDSLAKVDLVNTFASLDKVAADLAQITEKVTQGEGNLAMLINEQELYENIEKTTKNLELLLEDFRKSPGRYMPAIIRIGNR